MTIYLKPQTLYDWTPIADTNWTSTGISTPSASMPLETYVTVPGGTAKFQKGDKLKCNSGATTYYNYIVDVQPTQLVLCSGLDYPIAAGALTSIYYTRALNPSGFPTVFAFSGYFTPSAGSISLSSELCYFNIQGSNVNYFMHCIGTTGAADFTYIFFRTPVRHRKDALRIDSLSGLVVYPGLVAGYSLVAYKDISATNYINFAAFKGDGWLMPQSSAIDFWLSGTCLLA